MRARPIRNHRVRALVSRCIDAHNRMDAAAMLATMQDELVFENYSAGVLALRSIGIAELRHLAASTRHLFSMRWRTVAAWREADDCGYASVHVEGTFAIDLPNGVHAGQSIAMEDGTSMNSPPAFRQGRLQAHTPPREPRHKGRMAGN